MRIRWTTRIAMAVGVITLIAGIATGAGPASASSGHPAAATASASHVAGPR
jgi:hypothetical protein